MKEVTKQFQPEEPSVEHEICDEARRFADLLRESETRTESSSTGSEFWIIRPITDNDYHGNRMVHAIRGTRRVKNLAQCIIVRKDGNLDIATAENYLKQSYRPLHKQSVTEVLGLDRLDEESKDRVYGEFLLDLCWAQAEYMPQVAAAEQRNDARKESAA